MFVMLIYVYLIHGGNLKEGTLLQSQGIVCVYVVVVFTDSVIHFVLKLYTFRIHISPKEYYQTKLETSILEEMSDQWQDALQSIETSLHTIVDRVDRIKHLDWNELPVATGSPRCIQVSIPLSELFLCLSLFFLFTK